MNLSLRIYMLTFVLTAFGLGCASKILEYEEADKLKNNQEFSELVKVRPLDSGKKEPAALEVDSQGKKKKPKLEKKKKRKGREKDLLVYEKGSGKKEELPSPEVFKAVSKKLPEKIKGQESKGAKPEPSKKQALPVSPKAAPQKPAEKKDGVVKKEPELEDADGFRGRRPVVDPFRPGEKVTLAMSYFNITAGTMDIEVKPFVEVNGKKAYHFAVELETNSLFSSFYTVNDQASTHVTYDELVPLDFEMSIKESKQLKEIKTYFNHKKLKANYWETQFTKSGGEKSKKMSWDILPYSQNVISAVYYLRTFRLTPGKKLAFRVADRGKNILFTAEVLRREKLKTDVGEFNTVVVKPEIKVEGVFKQVGDIVLWLTDDDRKFVVRIESKIKIGTIIAKLKSLKKE